MVLQLCFFYYEVGENMVFVSSEIQYVGIKKYRISEFRDHLLLFLLNLCICLKDLW